MSVIVDKGRTGADRATGPRDDDPRVVRSRRAGAEAARTLFLRQGYAGTTMDEIAALAGLTKRTLYNVYGDKEDLFVRITAEVTALADGFVSELRTTFEAATSAEDLRGVLGDLGRRLALAILQPGIVALRRLLIGEARHFPQLAADYFNRAPGQVIDAIAGWFERLDQAELLQASDPRRAAAQFAYLIVGEPLDRAVLTGTIPQKAEILACADEGVETFMARYRPVGGRRRDGARR